MQVAQFHSLTSSISSTRQEIGATKSTLVTTKRALERLQTERSAAERAESDAKRAKCEGDDRVERACRWFQTSQSLLESLLGVREVACFTEDNNRRELRVTYDLLDDSYRTAKLRLKFHEAGDLEAAEVREENNNN
jgi:hypothetical protein